MPTGYTCKVVDGELTEFPKFAAQCARAFGALILLRDEPFTGELPDSPGSEGDYEERQLAKDEARLAELLSMSNDDARAAAEQERKERIESDNAYSARLHIENARLEQMMAKVSAWQVPSEGHEPMKAFMMQQLEISKRASYDRPLTPLLSGADWRAEQAANLRSRIERSRISIAEKAEREAERKRWLEQLRESLNNYQEPTDAPNLDR